MTQLSAQFNHESSISKYQSNRKQRKTKTVRLRFMVYAISAALMRIQTPYFRNYLSFGLPAGASVNLCIQFQNAELLVTISPTGAEGSLGSATDLVRDVRAKMNPWRTPSAARRQRTMTSRSARYPTMKIKNAAATWRAELYIARTSIMISTRLTPC
jgi:hypothetical protein